MANFKLWIESEEPKITIKTERFDLGYTALQSVKIISSDGLITLSGEITINAKAPKGQEIQVAVKEDGDLTYLLRDVEQCIRLAGAHAAAATDEEAGLMRLTQEQFLVGSGAADLKDSMLMSYLFV